MARCAAGGRSLLNRLIAPGSPPRPFSEWDLLLVEVNGRSSPSSFRSPQVSTATDEEVLANLKKAKERGGGATARYQYTLAMLQAALQMPEDAQQSLRLALAHEDYSSLDAKAWAVYGKVCKQYGFSKEAEAALSRARAGTNDDELTEWALSAILEK